MVRYVKTIDELVDMIDREFSGSNAVCPTCKYRIGTVGLPDLELGLPEFHFMQYRQRGVYCSEGHCVICFEEEEKTELKKTMAGSKCRVHIEDLGLKVFEVMKLIKPYLDVDDSMPNAQLYWVLMDKSRMICSRDMSIEEAAYLLDDIQKLGGRGEIVECLG
jgi:hypothetical protein